MPQTSSSTRRVIPAEFFGADEIASNKVAIVPGAQLWLFALLQSAMFTNWVHAVGGRLKSDINVTADLAYNAFPFPELTKDAKERLLPAAVAVRRARAAHAGASLADLYDRLSTPLDLTRAHDALDRVVDALYGLRAGATDADRTARLFERYSDLTSEGSLPRGIAGTNSRPRHAGS